MENTNSNETNNTTTEANITENGGSNEQTASNGIGTVSNSADSNHVSGQEPLKNIEDSLKEIASLNKQIEDLKLEYSANRVPTSDDSRETWDNFYKKLGRPENFDDYKELDAFKALKEIGITDDNLMARAAGNGGLTKEQANVFARTLVDTCKDAVQQSQVDLDNFLHAKYGKNKSEIKKALQGVFEAHELLTISKETIGKTVDNLALEKKYIGYGKFSGSSDKDLLKEYREKCLATSNVRGEEANKLLEEISELGKHLKSKNLI